MENSKVDEFGFNIFEMALHETYTCNGVFVFRVPGGWIYSFTESDATGVFVPLAFETKLLKKQVAAFKKEIQPKQKWFHMKH